MAGPEVLVVRTGIANLASVLAGLTRAGGRPRVSEDPEQLVAAERVVLPGVGAFGAGMETLRAGGLVEAVKKRIAAGAPTLAVCLGLQLLGETSEESPGVAGLGVWTGQARRFPDSVRVPQFGWNQVEPKSSCRYLRAGYAYFANSYRLVESPAGWEPAFSEHGGPFVAALEKGEVLACQFHPELSGAWGRDLLERWVSGCPEKGESGC